jgi:beta-lactamase regulating signal transducer with metallopeptidase domain
MTHELLNHLWQSTVFAAAVGFLSLGFRRNGAHTRYWLWFAASCKFLIPFSLLSGLGSHLSRRTAPAGTLPAAFANFAQPFSIPNAASALPSPPMAAMPAHGAGLNWLLVCCGIWACGAIAVAGYWMVRWLRLLADVKSATPLELDAPIPVRSSWAPNEPGVFGLFRPVLLLPEGICERLSPEQLRAILVHEMCHVRRRDNLTAAVHMVVEAVFWFHPLVWWIGHRMIVEREAACDEAVLTAGCDPGDYAEALLTICKFYVESPPASAAGVAGADLKKRIEGIMTPRVTYKLNAAKKALLAVAATAVVVAPIAIAFFFAAPTRATAQATETNEATFQSVSIQQSQPEAVAISIGVGPDTFAARNRSLRQVIAWAFDTESDLVAGPDTLDAKYNIVARASAPFPGGAGNDAVRAMVRNMLANQFQLQTHRDTQSILVVDHVTLPKSVVPAPTAVPMDPAAFDAYAGHYLFAGALVHVYRDGRRYFSQPPWKAPVEIFPEANGGFFAKAVDVQITFEKDAQGKVTRLVLHQAGQDFPMPRVDEATAKQMQDALSAKMQQKTATPGSEDALRRDVAELAVGKPDYERMSPELAAVTKDMLAGYQRQFQALGTLNALKFMGVDPKGWDVYEADFEHGKVEGHISMMPDGKIAGEVLRPLP